MHLVFFCGTAAGLCTAAAVLEFSARLGDKS